MQCMICMNKMSEHLNSVFFKFVSFFFIFPRLNECEMQVSYANAMIGLTNALCNHCAPIFYWQTLNYWPRCQFSINANKMWCKSRFFISDANAFWRRCKCKFFFMMQVSPHRDGDANVFWWVCHDANALMQT